MRLVVQRVSNAKVEVDEKITLTNRKWFYVFMWNNT